ncbi:MAG TPA: SMI1/KNR4 family protein [Polyangiaceae bacterium]|nr:SMI1/KNR4 family protein [Polyangiaceae bacterium]
MSSKQTPLWLPHLQEMRRLHTELARLAPYRDDGLVPNPSATLPEVAAAEARLGFALPPSYREFLQRHDGWRRFFDGVDLLGTDALGDPRHGRAAKLLLDRGGSLTASGGQRCLAPFGIDAQMSSVFAFDVNCASPEKPVVAWVGELGIEVPNFAAFLKLLAEIAEAELRAMTQHSSGLHSSGHTAAVNPLPDTGAVAA